MIRLFVKWETLELKLVKVRNVNANVNVNNYAFRSKPNPKISSFEKKERKKKEPYDQTAVCYKCVPIDTHIAFTKVRLVWKSHQLCTLFWHRYLAFVKFCFFFFCSKTSISNLVVYVINPCSMFYERLHFSVDLYSEFSFSFCGKKGKFNINVDQTEPSWKLHALYISMRKRRA